MLILLEYSLKTRINSHRAVERKENDVNRRKSKRYKGEANLEDARSQANTKGENINYKHHEMEVLVFLSNKRFGNK